jgi:predicted small lipoprotein YifL
MRRSTIAALAALTLLAVTACGGGDPVPGPSVDASASPDLASTRASPSRMPEPSIDPEGELCLHVAEVEQRLASLRTVELRLPNRVALEIELDKLQAAYGELEDTDLGDREDELERSLTRLGYRLGELDLAVEDFRTNTRPRRAAPHVEEDSQKVADELAAFVILSRC